MERGALSPFIKVPNTITELLSIGASVPIGTKGKVYVWGGNNMAIKQRLGISWIVTDPEGFVAEDYRRGEIDWTFEYVNPDEDHRFYGDQFDIDKPGVWTISIGLYMNEDNPVMVDSYVGVLCVVVEPVFAGKIVLGQLKYDGETVDIPIPV